MHKTPKIKIKNTASAVSCDLVLQTKVQLSNGISALPCGTMPGLCIHVMSRVSKHHLQVHDRCLVRETTSREAINLIAEWLSNRLLSQIGPA